MMMILTTGTGGNTTITILFGSTVWLMLLVGVSAAPATPSAQLQLQLQLQQQRQQSSFLRQLQNNLDPNEDFSCNVQLDQCNSKFNGVCDRDGYYDPSCNNNNDDNDNTNNSDCFDCDQCRQFNYDCDSCLRQNGCLWCPGDALCYNSPFYSHPGSSCPDAFEDFQENASCFATNTNEEPFFEYV
jgi:hypothetical protein